MTDFEFRFDFRPDYWAPENPVALVLGNMTGEMRRRALEQSLREGDGGGEPMPDQDREEVLSEERRRQLAFIHPWLMGGEYLPPAEEGELEIGRIVLASTTMDVVSIRACRRDGLIHYSIEDEYKGETAYLPPTTSAEPLTFGEMIELVDAIETEAEVGTGPYVTVSKDFNYDAGCSAQELVDFVRVESAFYPQLELFYEGRAQEWLQEKLKEEKLREEEERDA